MGSDRFGFLGLDRFGVYSRYTCQNTEGIGTPMSTVEIEVDDRGRASLKTAGFAPGRYRVTRLENTFELAPVRSYTDAELLALSSPDIQKLHSDYQAGNITGGPVVGLP